MLFYWDTSAIGSYLFEEKHSQQILSFERKHKALRGYTSFFSELELESLIQRKREAGYLLNLDVGDVRTTVQFTLQAMRVIYPDEEITDLARRIIVEYRLRSADALQLATALKIKRNKSVVSFLTFDQKLKKSANAEGFEVPLEVS